MREKIDRFLCIMLVLCAVLVLMATENPGGSGTSETTRPAQGTGETKPTSATAPLASDARDRVEQILDAAKLARTAAPHCVYAADLNELEGTAGVGARSCSFALAELCGERKMNPISAFWALEEAGMVQKSGEEAPLTLAGFDAPEQSAKQYSYSVEGARLLMGDLLALAGRMEDTLGMEAQLLGADGAAEESQVFFSDREDCYYGYFVCYGDRTAHFLCFYLRTDDAGRDIRDVEFQLLNMTYGQGGETACAELQRRGDRQCASLMAAAELLLTGKTGLTDGTVPGTYQAANCTAAVDRQHFTAEGETGTLTNYRLRCE